MLLPAARLVSKVMAASGSCSRLVLAQVAGLEHVQLNSTVRTAEAPADADGPESPRVTAMLAEARSADARKRTADDASACEPPATAQAADAAAFGANSGGGGGGGSMSESAAATAAGTAEPTVANSPAASVEQRPTGVAEVADAAAEPAAVGGAASEAAAATPMEMDDWELLPATEEAQGGPAVKAAAESDSPGARHNAGDGAAAEAAADESAPAQKKQKPSP